jgi:hypothetical protein
MIPCETARTSATHASHTAMELCARGRRPAMPSVALAGRLERARASHESKTGDSPAAEGAGSTRMVYEVPLAVVLLRKRAT